MRAGADGELAPWLAQDAFAWYLLGSARLYEQQQAGAPPNAIQEAERDFRRSSQLDAGFARAHRNLAMALIVQAMKTPQGDAAPPDAQPRLEEIRLELAAAQRLEPDLPLSFERGLYQFAKHDFQNSERLFRQAMADQPGEVGLAQWAARAVNSRQSLDGGQTWTSAIEPLAARFPDDGELHAHLAFALARDGRFVESRQEIEEARRKGFDASAFFGPQALQQVMGGALPKAVGRERLFVRVAPRLFGTGRSDLGLSRRAPTRNGRGARTLRAAGRNRAGAYRVPDRLRGAHAGLAIGRRRDVSPPAADCLPP